MYNILRSILSCICPLFCPIHFLLKLLTISSFHVLLFFKLCRRIVCSSCGSWSLMEAYLLSIGVVLRNAMERKIVHEYLSLSLSIYVYIYIYMNIYIYIYVHIRSTLHVCSATRRNLTSSLQRNQHINSIVMLPTPPSRTPSRPHQTHRRHRVSMGTQLWNHSNQHGLLNRPNM